MAVSLASLCASLKDVSLQLDERGVATLSLNRPDRANALSLDSFAELERAFDLLGASPDVRVVLLRGEGKHFCSGIDVIAFSTLLDGSSEQRCPARRSRTLLAQIRKLQSAVSSLERCRVPVVAAIHGACLGGGVDLVTAADIRLSTADAGFAVLEAELGFAADLGTLARLHRLVGEGRARELALTCRRMSGTEAVSAGLCTACFDTREALDAEALHVARGIAARSPLAMAQTKAELLFAREHSVAEALEHVALVNTATLASEDMQAALLARKSRAAPVFSKL
jgi:enoyl-CoA hydratase/carnithine racemase